MTLLLSSLMIVIGVVMIIRTAAYGGGALATGLILGLLFIAAGVGRMYLQRKLMDKSERRRRD
jgi:prolipoprotein diacylglyceryltransferase